MKIVFIGHPGSGKTYAANALAKVTGVEVIDIDNLLHNWVYFVFKKPYRRAFKKLLIDKSEWIIDGYAGKRMPPELWDDADYIVFIDLPKKELRQNIYSRYILKKSKKEFTHGQHLFINNLKNLWQIYILEYSIRHQVDSIKRSSNSHKLSIVTSRDELNKLLDKLPAEVYFN